MRRAALLALLLALVWGAAFATANRGLLQAAAPEPSTAQAAPRPASSTLTFGAVVPLTGGFASEGLYMELGYGLWAEKVNALGGIPILDRQQRPVLDAAGQPVRFLVDVSLRDDASNAQQHARLMSEMLFEGDAPTVDFVLGGHTSFGAVDGANGTAAKRLVFLCCTGPPQVYARGLAYLFGIHTSSDLYSRQLLKAATLGGLVESMAVVYNRDVAFTNSTCTAALGFAQQFGLRVAYSATYSAVQANDTAVFDALAREVAARGPAMVVGCTLLGDGYLLAEALVRAEVPSESTFITVMPATADAVARLGANTSRYLLSATQWHTGMGGLSTDQYRDDFFGSAADYATEFEAYSKGLNKSTPASYLGASPSAAAYALQLAIQNAFFDCSLGAAADDADLLLYSNDVLKCQDGQNNGYQRILAALRALRAPSFFGPIAFDRNQRNVGREPGTTQILSEEPGVNIFSTNRLGQGLTLALVLPSDASDAALVLPQPNRFRKPCAPGSTFNTTNEFAPCVLCPAGSFGDGASATCERCDLQSYSDAPGAAACMRCPANSVTRERGSRSIAACVCLPGYYAAGPGQDCEPCPQGAQCVGGRAPPYPLEGFWTNVTDQQDVGQVYSCSPSRNCAGGPTSACNGNYGGGPYDGPLCFACQPGYYMAFGSCQPCQSTGVMVLIYLAVLLMWVVLNSFVYRNVSYMDLAVNMFQLLSVTGQMNLTWPQSLQTFFGVAKLFAFEVDVVSPVCDAPYWGFKENQLVQLCLPPAFTLVYFAVHFCRVAGWRLAERRRLAVAAAGGECDGEGKGAAAPKVEDSAAGSFKGANRPAMASHDVAATQRVLAEQTSLDRAIAASMAIVAVSYVALSQYSVNAFVCQEVSGVSVMTADPSQPCSGSDYTTILALGITGTIVYVLGLPVAYGIIAWRLHRRKALEQRRNMMRFGWVYEAYKLRWFFWAILDLLQRCLFIVFVAAISDPSIEVLAAGTTTLAALVAVNAARPFVAWRFNVTQSLLLCLLIFVCVSGLVFYNPLVSESTYNGLTATVITFICIIYSIFAFALPYELWSMALRWRAARACRLACAQAGGQPPPSRHMLTAFKPYSIGRLLLHGSRFASAAEGAVELARLSDAVAQHVSPHAETSHLSQHAVAIFWRRVLKAFPEVVDFLAVTDAATHERFVKTMEVLFIEFASSANPHRISDMIEPQQHAAFAHWLTTANAIELETFNHVVALMLGAATGDAGHTYHLERVRTFGRPSAAPGSDAGGSRHGPFVRSVSLGARSMSSALSAEAACSRDEELGGQGGMPRRTS